ncbi:MAG: hypothetical protein AAF614_25335 [Chloroflexota bacterium]
MRYFLLILSFLLLGCQPTIAEAVSEATAIEETTPALTKALVAQHPLEAHLAPNSDQTFDYMAADNETVVFTAQAEANLDIAFGLYTADLELLMEVDELGENGDEQAAYTFTKAGHYLVIVHEFNGRSGNVTLTAEASTP